MPRPSVPFVPRPLPFAVVLAWAAASFFLPTTASAQPGPPPSIELAVGEPTEEPTVLEASGLTPEGEVLWVWLERWPRGAYSATFSGERLDRADAAGVASLERANGVPSRALFLVMDLESGELGAGTPGTYQPTLIDLPRGAWVAAEASGGRGPLLRLPMHHPWIVLARPDRGRGQSGKDEASEEEAEETPDVERGVWRQTGVDGNEGDEDGAPDGVFEISVASFAAVEPPFAGDGNERPGPPARLRPTDLVVAFDLTSLTVIVSDLGRGGAGNGNGNGVVAGGAR